MPQIVSKNTFEAVQQILKQRVHRPPSNVTENYLLSGKICCGECGTVYSGARQHKGGYKYTFYKCNWNANYKNGVRQTEYCHNNTVRKDDMERYVVNQVSKIVFHESIIDQVLAEYNKYAIEVKNNSSLVGMLENQINDIDKQMQNIVNIVAMTGNFSELLQNKLNSLENDKKQLTQTLSNEKKGNNYMHVTKDELKRVYEKAQDILLNGTFEEHKTILHMFLNKVIVYKQNVEIYINLIPINLSGGLDLTITQHDYLTKNKR